MRPQYSKLTTTMSNDNHQVTDGLNNNNDDNNNNSNSNSGKATATGEDGTPKSKKNISKSNNNNNKMDDSRFSNSVVSKDNLDLFWIIWKPNMSKVSWWPMTRFVKRRNKKTNQMTMTIMTMTTIVNPFMLLCSTSDTR